MAGPQEMPKMENVPGTERESASPESGVRETIVDAGDAERELGELGKQVDSDSREIAEETAKETKELSKEIPERYDVPMSIEESAQVAALDARTSAAQERLAQEVNAALSEKFEAAPSVQALEANLREIDRQLEEAHKKGDGNRRQELEAQRDQVDGERKKLMAEQAAAKMAAEAAPAPEPAAGVGAELQPASVVLEGKLRDLEKQYKEAQNANDPDKKAALERQLEAVTKEWQDAAKAEGHVVERPREPVLERGEPANDNAIAADEGPEGVSPDAAAKEEVEAKAASGIAGSYLSVESGKPDAASEKQKKEKKDDEKGGDDTEKAFSAEYAKLDREAAQSAKALEDVLAQKELLRERTKKEKKEYEDEVGGPAGRGIAAAWAKVEKTPLSDIAAFAQDFMNATGEMVGGKKGEIKLVESLDDLAKKKKGFDKRMEGIQEKKADLSLRETKLSSDLAALSRRMSDLAGVALDNPAWGEVNKQKAALKEEEKAVAAEKAAVEEAEKEAEEEKREMDEEEKKLKSEQAAAGDAAAEPPKAEAAAPDREAILPPEPAEPGGEKPPEPPEPPAAAKPEEDEPQAPAAPKMAA